MNKPQGITVVKLGGRTQNDPALPSALAALWKSTGGRLVVVHGGGDQISALQRQRGEEPVFVGGRRFSSPLVLELVRMVLSGSANKQLVSALTAAGVPAVGLSGEDAAMLPARVFALEQLGAAGTPHNVNGALLQHLLAGGFLPVVSPVGTNVDDPAHGAVNVNGDDAAACIARVLRAEELVLMIDVEGVLDAHRTLIPLLTTDAATALVHSGVARDGMAAKIEASLVALSGEGLPRVRIGNLQTLLSATAGTVITRSTTSSAHAHDAH